MDLAAAKAAARLEPATLARLRAAAEDLEGVFLNTLTKEMFGSLDTSAVSFGGGFGEETWRSMQAETIAGSIARAGGIGIADALLPDLIRAQANAARPALPNRNF